MNKSGSLQQIQKPWGSFLPLMRGIVLILIVFSIISLLLNIVLFASSNSQNFSVLIPNDRWTLETTLKAVQQLGWSPKALEWMLAIMGWITAFTFCGVGLIVFARRGDSWFGLYVALVFAVLGTSGGLTKDIFRQASPLLERWQNITGLLNWQLLLILFYLFPDGHFVPRWTRFLLVGWVGMNLFWYIFPSITQIMTPVIAVLALSTLGSQIYRYLRYADAIQRQQTKWIVFMVAALIVIFFLAMLRYIFLRPEEAILGRNFMLNLSIDILGDIWFLVFPIVVGIAILMYRLWDIDIIIHKTLVYVPLTAILTGVYSASIKVTQLFLSAVDGKQSDTATVLTTLIVVAAFDPLKGWLQRRVDALFKENSNPDKRWVAYNKEVQSVVEIINPEAGLQRLLDEAVAAFDATSGAVFLEQDGDMKLVSSHGEGINNPAIMIPLTYIRKQLGALALGPRRNGRAYVEGDKQSLTKTANSVAVAIAFARSQTFSFYSENLQDQSWKA